MGLFEAINWLHELGVRRVTVELDCKAVVDDVRGVCNSVIENDSILFGGKQTL